MTESSRKLRRGFLSLEEENEKLREEIDALHAASEAREQQLLAVTHAMDDILLEVENQRNTLKKKNKQLLELNAYIRSINDAMNSILIVVGIDGMVSQVNRVFMEDLGWTEDEFSHIHVDSLFPKAIISHLHKETKLQLESFVVSYITQRSHLEFETTLYRSNGTLTESVYLVKGEQFYSHQGKLQGILLTATDISELRHREEALQHSQQALENRNTELADTLYQLKSAQQQLVQAEKLASLGQLVAGVAHEINNPISFIIGNVHALKRNAERLETYLSSVQTDLSQEHQSLKDELRIDAVMNELAPTIEDVMEAAGRVSGIVEDLSYSSAQQAEKSPVDLSDVISLAIKWVSANRELKNTIHFKSTASTVVLGHKGQLVQVIVNLLNNALDACKIADEPRVDIDVGENDAYGWLTVTDNGPGLNEAQIGKIFDPFFTTKNVGEGTGLGLAISYQLVMEHNGSLDVVNVANGGARFTLSLPLAKSS
ncbi:PAS domain-containing sensor histidine kinase [Enterovibrio coralii]|uniref:histidine kinase n=1 Tax=Enterovibrio coralii TaxID=294935 RepID=A0A135I573_9GAMM|nr:PAS domain-containing sensor histidine kinase [Enterovibrio coralii]KXF80606.1 hypothetical protein ATN88_08060 [Enterovibrio coralii]